MARATDFQSGGTTGNAIGEGGTADYVADIGSGDGNGSGVGSDNFGAVDAFGSGPSGGGSDDFDASIHIGRDKLNSDGSYRRKRGRKPRDGAPKEKGRSASVNSIEASLIGIHTLLAAFTRTPELALDADESKPLAVAVAEVAKHYDIPGLDAKAMAWVGLVMVSANVYGPRVLLIKMRMEKEKAEKAKNVTPPMFGVAA